MTSRLRKSSSEDNVYVTYVCMDNVLPNTAFNKFGEDRSSIYDHEIEDSDDNESIKVEKSKALHDLVETDNQKTVYTCDFAEVNKNCLDANNIRGATSNSDIRDDFTGYRNPNILRLTKMKWLTESESTADSSSESESLMSISSSSIEDYLPPYIDDTHLSTILKLDREHNLFGLSNALSDQPQASFIKPKKSKKPVFPQTTIIQVACCMSRCCRHQSNSDYPVSLKCGSCNVRCETCCAEPSCKPCCKSYYSCNTCSPLSCCKPPCKDRAAKCCKPLKCRTDDSGNYGLTILNLQRFDSFSAAMITHTMSFTISVNKRPKYKPEPILITPKSSCILAKPMSARTCTHCPACRPPSSCFPYLMPCFWPSRPSAPCTASKCFHNPPCQPARCPRLPDAYLCPTHKKCSDTNKPCTNSACAMYGKTPKKEEETEAVQDSKNK